MGLRGPAHATLFPEDSRSHTTRFLCQYPRRMPPPKRDGQSVDERTRYLDNADQSGVRVSERNGERKPHRRRRGIDRTGCGVDQPVYTRAIRDRLRASSCVGGGPTGEPVHAHNAWPRSRVDVGYLDDIAIGSTPNSPRCSSMKAIIVSVGGRGPLGEKRRRVTQDLVRSSQLGHFPAQLLQLRQLIGCRTGPHTGVTFRLPHSLAKRLRRAATLQHVP